MRPRSTATKGVASHSAASAALYAGINCGNAQIVAKHITTAHEL